MNWHITCRVGLEDTFSPAIGDSEPRLMVSVDAPGAPSSMRCNFREQFRQHLGGMPDSSAGDLLNLATAVFTADVCIPRKHGEERWTRTFTVYLPVCDLELWKGAVDIVSDLLGFLTGDRWTFCLRSREPVAVESTGAKNSELPKVVSLFSGGLDSLVGAIDLLHSGQRVALVGHYGAGMTHTYQARVAELFEKHYPGMAKPLLFHAQPPTISGDNNREQTMRARSFLFIALGVAAASRLGPGVPLFVPENGLISLNVPLTVARAGSNSTRTTHPHYIKRFSDLLSALAIDQPLVLPYRFKTKGQMLKGCTDQKLLGEATPLTMSCAHPEGGRWEGTTPGTHCGYCYPCLIRRAATSAAGTQDASYSLDVLTETPDASKPKGRDFRALAMAVERYSGKAAKTLMFDVLDSGPVAPEEIANYTQAYREGMDELSTYLAKRRS